MKTKEREEQLIKEILDLTLDYSRETGLLTYKAGVSGKVAGSVAGSLNEYGYRRIARNGVQIRASHIAWYAVYGELPDRFIAFRNGRDDTRIENLYLCTRLELAQKKSRPPSWSKTGILGVDEKSGKYRARITKDGKRSEALFDDVESAELAYLSLKHELHPSFSELSSPPT